MDISCADGDVRYVPDEGKSKDFCTVAHESRYHWVRENFDLNGKTILDFGCGSGYGAELMTDSGGEVLGIDISRASIDYAKRTYTRSRFMAFDLTDQSIPAKVQQTFDLVVSFDVIEHVEKYWAFVENIKALLKPGGTAIVGCPNRLATFDLNVQWNPYHKQEFTPIQLDWLLSRRFGSVVLYGQDFVNQDVKRRMVQKVQEESKKRKFFGRIGYYLSRTVKKLTSCYHVEEKDLLMKFDPIAIEKPETHATPYGLIAICK